MNAMIFHYSFPIAHSRIKLHITYIYLMFQLPRYGKDTNNNNFTPCYHSKRITKKWQTFESI